MLQRVEVRRSDYLYRKVAKGRPYVYFRLPPKFGGKLIPLPADEASVEFKRQYDACVANLRKMEGDTDPQPSKPPRTTLAKFVGATIGKAIGCYRASKKFTTKKASTVRIYTGVLDDIKEKIGDEPLRQLDRDAAEEFRDDIYRECGSASMADLYLTLISNVWKEVRTMDEFGIRKLPNPAREIERKRKPSEAQPHLIWDEDVQEKFDAVARDHLWLARQVLHYTTQRGVDAIRIKWTHYDGKGVKVWPEKTTKKGAVLEPNYHLLPKVLIRALDKAKATATSEYILVTSRGDKWASAHSLSDALKRRLIKIGVRKQRQKRGPTMHGLRHTGASEISLLPGVGVKGIMSQTGHKSQRLALHYAEQADKRRANENAIAAWDVELERKEAEREAKRHAKRAASLRVVK